jgi:asparaginyl-tRNA synthetase
MATYEFFDQGGFIQVDTPIISASDCEGAGEMFHVTTIEPGTELPLKGIDPDADDAAIYDMSTDFFGEGVGLTVSGQLEAETAALGLGRVYTFGPTFRAEKSQTSRHLAEFWMIEPEISFADLEFTSMLAEGYLRCVIGSVLQKCSAEVDYLEEYIQEEEKNMKQELRSTPLRDKLEDIVITKFEKITYTEAFDILKRSKPAKKGKFEFPIEEWGMDFQSEHERYLVEKHFNAPVIVTDYPKEIKAFYMRDNEDGKTVAAMDILFPGIGEIVGGSQREERLDVLKEKMTTFGISHDEMSWYLDTRRFGTAPHSGFGVGFERLVQFTTGMKNIRDVILYPRTPGKI